MEQPIMLGNNIDLNGVSEEDAAIIRHLSWLYGGYQMRTRERANLKSQNLSYTPEAKIVVRKKRNGTKSKGQNVPNRIKPDRVKAPKRPRVAPVAKRVQKPSIQVPLPSLEQETKSDESDSFYSELLEEPRNIGGQITDHRRPRWPSDFGLDKKIESFTIRGIANKTDLREANQATTLSICKQFALQNHEAMVADSDRVHYYRAAIFWTGFADYGDGNILTSRSNISDTTSITDGGRDAKGYYCSGKRIVEIGTGPMCVLAMNALNAGAQVIDALEVCPSSARLATKLMAAYGFDNRIRVFHCHSKQFVFDQREFFKNQSRDKGLVSLPERAPYDMVISEILGDFASQEGVADVFVDFQQRYLLNSTRYLAQVKSIPKAASTAFVPCTFPDHDNIVYKASKYPEMTIFTPTFKMLQSVGIRMDNLPLAEDWGILEHLEFEDWMEPQMCQHYENMFTITDYGTLCGFLSGIDVEIRPGEHFGTRFGHCESWYTNILLLDQDYKVSPGDVILTRSICNLTNYTQSHSTGQKIWASCPSYTVLSFILSPVNLPPKEVKVYHYDQFLQSSKLKCAHLDTDIQRNTGDKIDIDVLTRLPIAKSTPCMEPQNWLEQYKYVQIGQTTYRIQHRPPCIVITYAEQSCAIYNQPPTRRKLPKRFQQLTTNSK
ncbi:bifunctional Protein arginine N-methyltransferase/S-adenosyl-L-methionine-dependent methyltransferase superfamily [Babesia duncani]|uniref:Bifunctional Protein arginine N-methyltransferase/S-adenosyl-L-methionine-dependent methyltransferase superfamily n=1 Tax=Babesia duncani TaxID=323732 RepID=A0AAD9PH78_9APIC|nr:bifunctional Protein arginine N-methyltransferase/S-adenosyl-L-methionine-dependent methyltransferase superfamily [Babesia duncani]KAK2197905.1 bifunctional Protein arginine N-methyltransferase/S-adenosyl-L-methionine-dependent methyltransferase superfamily [Babesia duncani]